MTTVLSVHTSEGCVGRCDARCHEAHGPVCKCICGGVNHGVGAQQAADNVAEMGQEILQRWRAEHGDAAPATMQLALPWGEKGGSHVP